MKFHLLVKDGACHVRAVGDIAAGIGAAMSELTARIDQKLVVFDLTGLTTINSIGCAEWARQLLVIASSRLVEMTNCPIAFIDYSNMIPAMLGAPGRGSSVMIRSFMAPYYCKPCKTGISGLVTLDEVVKTRKLPVRTCPKCGSLVPPEVESEDYLKFLDRTI